MSSRLYLDIETRSECDLEEAGLHAYAAHPSTQIVGFSYAFDNEQPQWVDCVTGSSAMDMQPHLAIRCGVEVWMHNAEFDRTIWNRFFPAAAISIAQSRCTVAGARSMGLPGPLFHVAPAVGLSQKKDFAGHNLMKKLCRPKEPLTGPCPERHGKKLCWRCKGTGYVRFAWWEDQSDYDKLGDYCNQDIRTTQALANRILPLTPRELEIYHVDQTINDRGVLVDLPLARKAKVVWEIETMRLDAEIKRLTGGAVRSGNCHAALKRWLIDWGIPVDGTAQEDVTAALARDDLPDHCRAVLQARHDIGKSSLAKIPAFLSMVSPDGRLRGNLNYHGAGQTARWTGKGVQLHNLPRPELPLPLIRAAIKLLQDNTPEEWIRLCSIYFGNPLNVLADCLRGLLIPDPDFRGCRPVLTIHDEILLEVDGAFVALDYAQVEARALALLTGHEGDLKSFREGKPIYEMRAAKIFGMPWQDVKKDSRERHVGKEITLASGFGLGWKTFQKRMASQYQVRVTAKEAKAGINGWREDHPESTGWWDALRDAAFAAVENPGVAQPVRGGVSFRVSGSFLFCRLPSGRDICYPYPRLEDKVAPWGATVKALTYMVWRKKQWVRDSTFGGKLAENIVQGYCRDLLADAVVRFEKTPPSGRTVKELENFMAILPSWASGMPMKVEGWMDRERYRK